jgi:hypothetical protein
VQVLWRILQAGDAGTVPSGVRRSAICLTFAAGTFSTSSPVTSLSSGSGTSTTPEAATSSVDFPVGLHLRLLCAATNGSGGVSPVTYPYSSGNRFQGAGSSTLTYGLSSAGNFDGGFAGSAQFTVANSLDWAAAHVAIRGYS